MNKSCFSAFIALLFLLPVAVQAASPDADTFAYVDYGQWDTARQGVLGIEGPGPLHYSGDSWTSFWQAEVGEWFTKKDNARYENSTELAFGPVGRYYLSADHAVYFDGLANLSAVRPRFWRGAEQQGSVFNFAGGFAFGYRFGAAHASEVSFGAEHFSNGGLKDPNPGRNFFQLRYAFAF